MSEDSVELNFFTDSGFIFAYSLCVYFGALALFAR